MAEWTPMALLPCQLSPLEDSYIDQTVVFKRLLVSIYGGHEIKVFTISRIKHSLAIYLVLESGR